MLNAAAIGNELDNHCSEFLSSQEREGPGGLGSNKVTRLPRWALGLPDLIIDLERQSRENVRYRRTCRPAHEFLFYIPLCIPIARFAIRHFETKYPSDRMLLLSSRARKKLDAWLISRLLAVITPTAACCFRRHRPKRAAEGARGAQFFYPSPARRLLRILCEFPVLARLIVTIVADWEDATAEFLKRLKRDKSKLYHFLNDRHRRGRWARAFVSDLIPGLSDPHNGGRTVMAVRVLRDKWVIYKPRSCRGEQEWGRLLKLLRDTRLRPYHPKLLLRKRYGWVEYVRQTSCRSSHAARFFYRRAGALLCVAQISGAVDLHRGNMIAAGAHPVVVDIEALWQPTVDFSNGTFGSESSLSSLLRTGFLPVPKRITSNNTFSHSLDSAAAANPQDRHRARLHGQILRALDFIGEIEGGFRAAAKELCGGRACTSRCQRIIDRISRGKWRIIIRPTAWYSEVREWSLLPDLMRNGQDRYSAILNKCALKGIPPQIAAAEAEAIFRFDIPSFAATANIIVRDKSNEPKAPTSSQLPTLPELLALVPLVREALSRVIE